MNSRIITSHYGIVLHFFVLSFHRPSLSNRNTVNNLIFASNADFAFLSLFEPWFRGWKSSVKCQVSSLSFISALTCTSICQMSTFQLSLCLMCQLSAVNFSKLTWIPGSFVNCQLSTYKYLGTLFEFTLTFWLLWK